MEKLVFIINQASREGRRPELVQQAKRNLWGFDLDFRYPNSAEELVDVCRNLKGLPVKAVLMIGGDGTVNTALKGLIDWDHPPILPFPGGTANDLANEMGIYADWNQIQRLVATNQVFKIDTIEINNKPFATVGGVGIGAALTADMNRLRQKHALLTKAYDFLAKESYSLMAAFTIFKKDDYVRTLKIKSKDFSQTVRVSSMLVSNQPLLGGGLLVCPFSRNDDGMFEVSIISSTSKYRLIENLLKGRMSRRGFPFDFRFQAKELEIENIDDEAMTFFGDGDFLSRSKRCKISINPRSLKVFGDPTLKISRYV